MTNRNRLAPLAAALSILATGSLSALAVLPAHAADCVPNGTFYAPTSGVAEGPHCYSTADESPRPRLAQVDPTKTGAQLAAVQTSSPFKAGSYMAENTMATRDVNSTITQWAPNSTQIAQFTANLPTSYVSDTWKGRLFTSISVGPGVNADGSLKAGTGVGGNESIPIYMVDSSNPHQTFAEFSSTDSRVVNNPSIAAMNSGKVPVPTWFTPGASGDHSVTVYDVATGIYRGYFNVAKTSDGHYSYSSGAYLYADADSDQLTRDNYWLSYLQGTSSVSGLANELTQIGADEIAAGEINHMVSVTAPNAASAPASFPGKQSDGNLSDSNAPKMGQIFTIDPSVNVDAIPGLNKMEKMIAHAVQKHGGIVTDTNRWTWDFHGEPPVGRGPNQNPWVPGGKAFNAVDGNFSVNNFPWKLTKWAAMNNAQTVETHIPDATPTPEPTVTPQPSSSATPTPVPTKTPEPTVTPVPTKTTEPSATPTSTAPKPSVTPTDKPTVTPVPSSTGTPVASNTATPTPSDTATPAPSGTPVVTPSTPVVDHHDPAPVVDHHDPVVDNKPVTDPQPQGNGIGTKTPVINKPSNTAPVNTVPNKTAPRRDMPKRGVDANTGDFGLNVINALMHNNLLS